MGCGTSFVKYVLFFFNLVVALFGLVMVGVGVAVLLDWTPITSELQKQGHLSVAPWLFIIIGAIMFVIAFFGCCGAIRESHCMVVTYAIFLLVIIIVQVVVAVLMFTYADSVQSALTGTINKLFDQRSSPSDADRRAAEQVFNNIQLQVSTGCFIYSSVQSALTGTINKLFDQRSSPSDADRRAAEQVFNNIQLQVSTGCFIYSSVQSALTGTINKLFDQRSSPSDADRRAAEQVFNNIQLQVSTGCFIYSSVQSALTGTINKLFDQRSSPSDADRRAAEQVFNNIQLQLQCCGKNGPTDYGINVANLPASCCTRGASVVEAALSTQCSIVSANTEGCGQAVEKIFKKWNNTIAGVAIGIACVECSIVSANTEGCGQAVEKIFKKWNNTIAGIAIGIACVEVRFPLYASVVEAALSTQCSIVSANTEGCGQAVEKIFKKWNNTIAGIAIGIACVEVRFPLYASVVEAALSTQCSIVSANTEGCGQAVEKIFKKWNNTIAGVAIGVACVEAVEKIFKKWNNTIAGIAIGIACVEVRFPLYASVVEAALSTQCSIVSANTEGCGQAVEKIFKKWNNTIAGVAIGVACVECSIVSANTEGCGQAVEKIFKKWNNTIAGVAIGIACVEVVGALFALCLANSIRNMDRRYA
ncbi:tetraspanin family domain-containing protein [Phthorimaea operculella]|nr:tetraspanin family domain-containing protein [Phthorimaea operculella]